MATSGSAPEACTSGQGEAAPTAEDPAAAAQPAADKPPVTEPAAPEPAPDPVDQLPAFVAAPPVAEDNAEAVLNRAANGPRAARTRTEAPEALSSNDQPVAAIDTWERAMPL